MRLSRALTAVIVLIGMGLCSGQAAKPQSVTYYPVDDSQRAINAEPPAQTDGWPEYPVSENQPGGCVRPFEPVASTASPVMTDELIAELKSQTLFLQDWLEKSALPDTTSFYGPANETYIYCQAERGEPRGIPQGLEYRFLDVTDRGELATQLSVAPIYPEISTEPARFMSVGASLAAQRMNETAFMVLQDGDESPFGAGDDDIAFERLREGADWVLNSGYVGAIAYDATVENRQVSRLDFATADFSDNTQRSLFMPGRYDQPVYMNNRIVSPEYSAAAFWYFVWKRHLPDEGTFAELVKKVATSQNTMEEVNVFIDRHDTDYYDGFAHAFANFVAWHAAPPPGVSEDTWLEDNFGGCDPLDVDEMTPYSSVEFDIQPYSAKCFEASASSALRAWTGQPTLRLTGSPDLMDNINISFAETARGGRRITCVAWIAGQSFSDCLMIPEQALDTETGIASRFFQFDEMDRDAGQQARVPLRFLVSYVPDEHTPYELFQKPGEPLKVTLSLDVTSSEEGWFAQSDLKSAYGRKSGLTPPGPPPTRKVSSVDEQVMDGSSIAVDPDLLQASLSYAENAITISDEDGNTLNFSAKDPSALSPLKAGRVLTIVSGTLASGALITGDTERDSFLDIIEVNEASARYKGTANVCIATMAQIMQAGMIEGDATPCQAGERRKVIVSGAIPFPAVWTAEGALKAWETENYRALRDMRLERIRQGPAAFQRPVSVSKIGPPRPFALPDRPPQRTYGGGTPSATGCVLQRADGSCDCSCEAKACFDQLERSSRLPSNAMACRLSCAKAWQFCS